MVADQPGACPRLPQRRHQPGEQPRRGRDHRPARLRRRSVPRRLPELRHPRPARPRARHPRQPGHLAGPGAAAGRARLRGQGDPGDGPLAGRRGEGQERRPARQEDHRQQAGGHHRRVHERHRPAGHGRNGLPGDRARLRDAGHGGRRVDRHRLEQVPAQADEPRRLSGRVHRRRVGAAPDGLPDRCLRLEQARRRPAGHDPVADLPGGRRQRDLRRAPARPGAALGALRLPLAPVADRPAQHRAGAPRPHAQAAAPAARRRQDHAALAALVRARQPRQGHRGLLAQGAGGARGHHGPPPRQQAAAPGQPARPSAVGLPDAPPARQGPLPRGPRAARA